IKFAQSLYCIIAYSHKGGGNRQPAILSGNSAFAIQTVKFSFRQKLDAFLTGQFFNQPGTGIVARVLVFGSGVSEADNQLNRVAHNGSAPCRMMSDRSMRPDIKKAGTSPAFLLPP